MGWGRLFLLGNIGQQLDLEDRQREIEQLRSEMTSQSTRDGNQEALIGSLHEEVRELKLCIASLVKLLAAKRVVTEQEVQDLARVLDGT